MSEDIQTYAELQKQMREALRNEHPEWIESDGESPILDLYEARLAELLDLFSHRPNSGASRRREVGSRPASFRRNTRPIQSRHN